MLILAPTASSKVGARGLDPFGGRFLDLEKSAPSVALLYLCDLDLNLFSDGDKWDKDGDSFVTSDPFAAEGKVIDGHFDFVALRKRDLWVVSW